MYYHACTGVVCRGLSHGGISTGIPPPLRILLGAPWVNSIPLLFLCLSGVSPLLSQLFNYSEFRPGWGYVFS